MRARGWRVFASCRAQADCDKRIAEGFESPLIDYAAPLTIKNGLDEVLAATGGRLDALFNNGAFACPGAVEDLPTDALRAIFEANFFGWHDLSRRVIPVMRAQGAGRIVQCSSILGFTPAKWRGAYVATKYALEGLSDVLRIEMRSTGVRVILIEPGPIKTRIRENARAHFERWIDVESLARAGEYAALQGRLYDETGSDTFELLPDAVSKRLIHALEAANPRPRYYVTLPTHIMGAMRRLLSTRQLDWLVSKY